MVQHQVIQLDIPVGNAHGLQVIDTMEQLFEAACHLLSRHHPAHHNRKEVIGSILHNFIKRGALLDNIKCFNDVLVM
jgi:hypothetical protein